MNAKRFGKIERYKKEKGTGLGRLYLLHLTANLIGFSIVLVLDFVTPIHVIVEQRTFLLSVGGWAVLALFPGLAFLLSHCLQYFIQRPISKVIKRIHIGEGIHEDLHIKAKRRLLNLPFIIVGLDLLIWIVLPALILAFFYFLREMPGIIIVFLFFKTAMVGFIASTLSFLLIEENSRKRLIPVLFPDGGLAALPVTLKISIRTRIKVLYLAGTAIPMIILAGTFFFALWDIRGEVISAQEFGREIITFTLIGCGIFVFLTLRLNLLVGKSILDTLREILGLLENVRNGDFGQKIRVLSNDEIGILADAGNDMIIALEERERIKETFGKYVTPEIRDKILEGRIPLNGERIMATVLFADLRGFTPYVEKNSPEDVITSIRDYFTVMQRAIRLHHGLVLQYVGDEIEAVFGVPLKYDDHAHAAVLAALEMRKGLEKLNRRRVEKGVMPFSHGIGIHTGEVLAGNTGSEDQPSYSLIGDTVNLASRIQTLTKDFDWDIVASEETVSKLTGPFQTQKQSPRAVKGFTEPVTVYRITS
jgi:class 3 adenylate cyclase